MFDTIFDGNEKQDHKKSMFESMRFLECPQSTAMDRTMQGRVATWGSTVPPEIPCLGTVQITGTEPGSTYAGHFFG